MPTVSSLACSDPVALRCVRHGRRRVTAIRNWPGRLRNLWETGEQVPTRVCSGEMTGRAIAEALERIIAAQPMAAAR